MNLMSVYEKVKNYLLSHQKMIRKSVNIFWIILFGILFWQVWKSRNQLTPIINNVDWIVLGKVSFYYILALIFAIIGWISIISIFTPKVPVFTHFKIYLATMATKRLPGTIWYISGRAILYKNLGISQMHTASASGLEIVMSFLANCVVAVTVLLFGIIPIDRSYFFILIIGILASLFVINPKTISWFMSFIKRPLVEPIKFWQPFLWLIIRFAVIISGGLMVFQIATIFRPSVIDTFWVVLGARALSGAASFLTFFLPSSFGAADITLAAILTMIMPLTLAGMTALTVRLVTTLFDVIIGFIFFLVLRKSPVMRNVE